MTVDEYQRPFPFNFFLYKITKVAISSKYTSWTNNMHFFPSLFFFCHRGVKCKCVLFFNCTHLSQCALFNIMRQVVGKSNFFPTLYYIDRPPTRAHFQVRALRHYMLHSSIISSMTASPLVYICFYFYTLTVYTIYLHPPAAAHYVCVCVVYTFIQDSSYVRDTLLVARAGWAIDTLPDVYLFAVYTTTTILLLSEAWQPDHSAFYLCPDRQKQLLLYVYCII